MKDEYLVQYRELEQYLQLEYKSILETNYYITTSDHVRERVLTLLNFESFIRHGLSSEEIQKRYDEIMNNWYKNGEIAGMKSGSEKIQEAGVMVAMIIRGEMYRDE